MPEHTPSNVPPPTQKDPSDPFGWAASAVTGKRAEEPDFTAGISSSALELSPAPQVRRVFAFFLDLAVALSPLFIIAFGSTASNAAEVTAFALGCLYFAARDSMFGRSIGKFLFGLRVIDAITSTPCSPVQAVKRDGLPLLTVGAAVLVTYLMSFIVGDDIAAAAGAVTILAAWVAPFAGFGSGRFRTLCDSIAATYVVSNRVWIASKAA